MSDDSFNVKEGSNSHIARFSSIKFACISNFSG